MDYRAVTTLALRLTGIAVLLKALPGSTSVFVGLLRGGASSPREALLLTVFATVIPLLAGLALIYFPSRLSSLVVGAESSAPDDRSERLGDVAAVAVGIYFFAAGIVDLVYYLSKYWLFDMLLRKDEVSLGVRILPGDFGGIVSASVQVVVGLVLAIKARTIYRWIQRVRETTPKRDNALQEDGK